MRFKKIPFMFVLGLLFMVATLPIALGDIWIPSFNDGLLAYFQFDETSGNTFPESFFEDITGILHEMENENWIGGLLGNALTFDGGSEYAEFQGTEERFNIAATNASTISVWINVSATPNNDDRYVVFGDNIFHISYINSGGLRALLTGSAGATSAVSNKIPGNSSWVHVVGTFNSSTLLIYVNGTLEGNATTSQPNPSHFNITIANAGDPPANNNGSTPNASIDEVGFWNRVLTSQEILDLYNGGIGFTFGQIVALDSPPDESKITLTNSEASLFFSANFTLSNGNFTNATLLVWNPDNTLFSSNTTTLNGIVNFSNLSLSSIPIGVGYNWNYLACSLNVTSGHNCFVSSSNFTFDYGFEVVSELFSNSTTEGQEEDFQINISIGSSSSISVANFVYNNTIFGGTINQINSTFYSISRNIEIPSVSTTTNQTFNWNFVIDGVSINSALHNQTVNNLGIADCSSNSFVILNYTLRDEDTQILLPAVTQNGTIEVDVDIFALGASNPVIEFSGNFTSVNNALVCLEEQLGTASYRMDVQTSYTGEDYVTEFHNIQNFTLTNDTVPQVITLFPLLTTRSQEFLVTFKDGNFIPTPDALITVTRKYINEGVFKTVEAPLTEDNGQAVVHLVLSDVVYTIQVTKNGEILAVFDNIVAFCNDVGTGDCKLNLNTFSSGIEPSDFESRQNISYVFDFNEATRTVSTIFSITGGGTALVSLNTTLFDHFGNTTVCSDSLTSSAGTLSCVVPASFGNTTIQAVLLKDNVFVDVAYFTIRADAADTFGVTGILFMFLLYITIPLMLISSGVGIIIGGIVGLIMAALLTLYNPGSGILGRGSTILWFIIAGAILVWKINQRRNE